MSGHEKRKLSPCLSGLEAWGLAFGCTIGWGCFIMPGTSFLPVSGPLGTVLGILAGACLMLVIGANYHYLINRYPDVGGAYTYTREAFGYDHGFLCSWFLALTYIAVVWANETALPLVARYFFGNVFQFGYLYTLAGYQIYTGEVLFSLAALFFAGGICIFYRKFAFRLETLLAILFFSGILVCFTAALLKGRISCLQPGFVPADPKIGVSDSIFGLTSDSSPFGQILGVMALAPWAFVGFESISHGAEEFTFPARKAFRIMALTVVAGSVCYICMVLQAAMGIPGEYANWTQYISQLGVQTGIRRLPVLSAAVLTLGPAGKMILCVTIFSAQFTSLTGCLIAACRLVYAMAGDDILPSALYRLNKRGTPYLVVLFIVAVSVVIPFLGRTAVGWHVDISNIGAAVAYGYTSAAAWKFAQSKREKITGALGVASAIIFAFILLVPNYISGSILATESYLMLAAWCIIGFLYFRIIFKRDKEQRFGRSMVVWIALLMLIFFTSLLWNREFSHAINEEAAEEISSHYTEEIKNYDIRRTEAVEEADLHFLQEMKERLDNRQLHGTLVQSGLLIFTLIIMFNVYYIMRKRERQMELEKVKAEERSAAKSVFLSNMSHDIRTPMNAIIGYTDLAMRKKTTEADRIEYLEKISISSQHLLSLINDILEMSRIESGKVELTETECSLIDLFHDLDIFMAPQAAERKQQFTVDTSAIRDEVVWCDRLRLNQILINLAGNAVKYTQEGGMIQVTAIQVDGGRIEEREKFATYEIHVKDNGRGMTQEFASRIFEAFEREDTSTNTGIQGTGLGMSITKNIVNLMGGTIELDTELGKGSEFTVTLTLRLAEKQEVREETSKAADFTGKRILLVDDIVINREIAAMMLTESGFLVDQVSDGSMAVEQVKNSQPGYYDVILMDIQMPVMNGYEATMAIRSLPDDRLSRIPILAMTANVFEEDRKTADAAGMNGHIPKPIDQGQMLMALGRVLKG